MIKDHPSAMRKGEIAIAIGLLPPDHARMPLTDRNFDDLSERFARNIYGSAKGEVRLAVVWQHLMETLPQLAEGAPLRILDAGCGLGQTGLKLAQQGHSLVMADLSEKMVEESRALFAREAPDADVQFVHAPVQSLDESFGQFDLVLFHAVLEWLVEPEKTLKALGTLIRPGGALSLMFYNREALLYRNLIRGNWHKAESGDFAGEAGGLTPYHPLSLDEVEQWLEDEGMSVLGRAGVRVIYDYMERRLRDSRDVSEVVRIEMKYARDPAYLRLGRYLHLIVRKG